MEPYVLNLNAFGSGLGLIMAGWMAGLVVSYVFSIIRRIGNLG